MFNRTKDGSDLKPTHRINAVRDGQSTYKLEFRDLIGEEDDGMYEITATNDEGMKIKGYPYSEK